MAQPQDLKAAKKALRERILAHRDAIDALDRRDASRRIQQRLLEDSRYQSARVVAAYASFGSEFDTSGLIADALASGKALLLPRIDKPNKRLELRRVNNLQSDLVAGTWGIREPALHCPVARADSVDYMLVPGVAFTVKGDRLGYGGGYYDRLMSGLRADAARIAATFCIQVVDALPMDEYDQRVNAVVTEI